MVLLVNDGVVLSLLASHEFSFGGRTIAYEEGGVDEGCGPDAGPTEPDDEDVGVAGGGIEDVGIPDISIVFGMIPGDPLL